MNKKTSFNLIILTIVILTIGLGVWKFNERFIISFGENKLISCREHIDKDLDMVCDVCHSELPLSNYAEVKSVKAVSTGDNKLEIYGYMPKNSNASIAKISESSAITTAKKYKKDILDEDVVAGFDISLDYNNKKYEPSKYSQKIDVKISNLDLDTSKTYALLHIIDENDYEILPIKEMKKDEITFTTGSFSTYIIITVGTNQVTFSGENFKVLDTYGNEITNGATVASGTDFNFNIVPNNYYGITDVNCSTADVMNSYGDIKGKACNISSVSENMTISVTTAIMPRITTQPVSAKIKQGSTAEFSVVASSATTYEWQYRENKDDFWKSVTSEMGDRYTPTNFTLRSTGHDASGYEFRCLVGNANFTGDERVKSDIVTVSIANDDIVVGETPIIMIQPNSDTTKVKENMGKATYSVTAMGGSDMTFTWQYRENKDDFWKTVIYTIASTSTSTPSNSTTQKPLKKSTLTTVNMAQSLSGYEFRCLVGNSFYKNHDAVKSDIVTVGVAQGAVEKDVSYVQAVVKPEDVTIAEGNDAKFTAGLNPAVSGLKYEWHEVSGDNDINLATLGTIYMSNNKGRANSTSSEKIIIKASGTATIAFDYMVSSEANDKFTVSIEDANGTTKAVEGISGIKNWATYSGEFTPNASGEIVLNLSYVKNGTIDGGEDYGAIKNLSCTSEKSIDKTCTYVTDDTFKMTTPDSEAYDTSYTQTTHTWVTDTTDSSIFKSNNKGVANSQATASVEISLSSVATLSFDYRVSSEGGSYDWMNISVIDSNGKTEVAKKLGGTTTAVTNWQTYTASVTPDSNGKVKILLLYRKDSSSNNGDDIGAIRNIKINGQGIVTDNCTFASDDVFTLENNYKAISYIGADTNTLTIPASLVTLAKNGYKYYCDIEGIVTNKATLNVTESAKHKMITEWTIPTDNTEIKLPVQGTGLNITVDWGDGSAEQTVTTEFPTHTYATAGTYEIKVWGTCPKWGYASMFSLSQSSNYYTYTRYLTKVKQFGELSATKYGFAYCSNLTEVSGESIATNKTFEKVTDMSYMFSNCTNLTTLETKNFNTNNVTTMGEMFSYCSKLINLNLKDLDTSSVTNMLDMFYSCKQLTRIDVSGFDTSKVTNMSGMFSDCSNLTSLDVSGFDTSQVTEMEFMFADCNQLTNLDLSNFNTNKVTTMRDMFSNCSNLTSLNISGIDTGNVTDMYRMFYNCSSLTSLDVSGFDTSRVTSMYNTFYNCSSLTSLDVSGFDTSRVTSMYNTFYNCSKLTSLDVSNFDTRNVTNMVNMFYGCSNLTSLDVSGFDTSRVTSMYCTFYNCSKLTSLDVSNFDTRNVTNMIGMFYNCSNLTSLDVSGFDTSNVETIGMNCTFYNCSKLTSLDVSNFDTKNVTNMVGMFYGCSNLTSLDLSSFDTNNVTEIRHMFNGCSNLKSLQLSSKFVIPASNVTDMFTNTTNLTSIILVDSTPLASQFTNIKSQLDGKTFYVPNKVAETAYEELWSGDFTADRIKPILELVGDENVSIKMGEDYTDAGYNVTGFDKTNSGDYTVYGYNVTTSGEVNTAVAGKYTIEYILTRTYNNGTETVTEEVMRETRTVDVVDTASYMITEWNVSGDAGLEITLPVRGTGLNIIVDWGDGTEETITQEYPTHTYARAGVYEIAVAGNCPEWGYKESNPIGNQSKYYTYTQYLIGIKQWGELNATRYGFSKCINLKYVHGNATANTFLKLNDMTRMFCDCKSLQELDLSFINSSNVTCMHGVFAGCTNLKSINLDTLNTNKVNDMSNMFSGCNSLKDLDLKNFDTSNVKYMYTMFYDCKSLTKLDISNFVTNNVVGMTGMFKQCRNLVELNLTSIDTSNVTSMFQMFNACNSLKELDLSNFNTSKVTSTNDMFYDCRSLEKLDISNFDTSNVTNMYDMFCGCKSLKELDVSSFDTSKVDNMMSMFANCSSLERLNISNFNTSNVTAMNGMFRGCSKVETLNLKNIELANVKSMNEMFAGCTKLKSILTSEKFVISGDTTDMFNDCPNLTAIITTSTTPVANQFKGQLPTNTKLYVPNGCEDAYKEILSGDTDTSKIKPIIEPIGETEVGMLVGTSYEEQNYTVAGFGIEDAKYYMAYGYDVKVSGDVNTNECGTYKVEYTLTRTYTDENGVQKEESHTATRTVYVYDSPIVHLHENNKPYYGDWTNQDVVAIMTILSPQTTWVSVKVENGDWTEEPSYADIVKSGEQMVVTFHESLNGKVYFKEVDVTGNATTYQSKPSIIKIDKEKPVVQDMTAKTIDGVIKLEAKVFDSLSGIAKYSIMQSGETQIAWKEYDRTDGKIEEILPSSGTYYLWLKDVAGNVSNGDYMNVIKDVEAPKGTIDIIPTNVVSGDKYTNQDTVLINLNVTDNQTEQARIMYALYNEEDYEQVKAGTKEIEWKQYTPTVTWTLKEPQGINVIYAVFKDTAGNITMTKGAAVQKP